MCESVDACHKFFVMIEEAERYDRCPNMPTTIRDEVNICTLTYHVNTYTYVVSKVTCLDIIFVKDLQNSGSSDVGNLREDPLNHTQRTCSVHLCRVFACVCLCVCVCVCVYVFVFVCAQLTFKPS